MAKNKSDVAKINFNLSSKEIKSLITSSAKNNSTPGRIRKIGNSKGVILSNRMIKELGVADDAEVTVITMKGRIIIMPPENKRKINTDLSTWEAQFKAAIKNGDKPEKELFEGMENKFDKEW